MADKPQNPPVDPDAPTEQSVKQALDALPTWEEWLAQNQFIKGEKHRSAISAVEWNRDFPKFGRGWRLRVAPATDTVNIIVYNGTLSRKANQIAMVSVGERSVVNILTKLITEIERLVSDVTKKRRLRAITSAIPYEEREEKPEFINGPVMTLDNLQQRQEEAGPIRRPVPDNSDELNPDQFGQLLNRLQVRCFPKGQRVRIRTPRHIRLNGELGTVVDAGPHACYVAIDSYVEAGDPDPFRFQEDELEPVYESIENVDDPEPYLDALDYVTPLKQLGYTLRNGAHTKNLSLGQQVAGYLRIKVHPRAAGVIVYVDYQAHGEFEHIAEMSASAIDIVDTIREVEQMAADAKTASEFTQKMQERQFPNTVVVGREGHLYYLFGESALEPDDVDDPQPYFQELQRHIEIINAFRDHGVRMRRRMKVEHPYYALFWIPNAVTDVSYDLYLEPDGTAWTVSAEGHKRFDHERWGEFDEDFAIDRTWTIPAGAAGEELAGEVDNILSDIGGYQGPEEPTVPEPDYDDLDESVDDEIGDYEAYAKASAGWNPVRMLTSKQIRQFVREAGFKVSTIYRSRTDHGWSVTMTPATAQALEVFQQNPHRMAEYMEHTAREAIKKLMPHMAKIERGTYNLDDRLYVHAWGYRSTTSADPSNPNNWVVYLDIRPVDYQKYRRGGIKEAEDPDEIKDVLGYFKGATDAVKVLEEFGYIFDYDRVGRLRWNKYLDLPQPVTGREPWSPVWHRLWLSPDVHGQLVYGLQSEDRINASDTGHITVRPLKRPAGVDDYDIVTSIRRMLLKVEDLARNFPSTDSMVEARQYLRNGMRRVQEEVNAEADKTWVPEAVDPDDPSTFLDRARAAKMGDTVEIKCPACGGVKFLGKNWPDDLKGWGTTCDKCQAFILLGGEIVMDAVPQPPDDDMDPAAYAADTLEPERILPGMGYRGAATEGGMRYWYKQFDNIQFVVWFHDQYTTQDFTFDLQVYELNEVAQWRLRGSSAGHPLSKLKRNLELWEKRIADKTLFDERPGAMVRLVGEGIDDPEEVLPQHRPKGYALYAQYANYDAPVSFSTFKTLPEAVARAKGRNLHNEYDYVWADELEFDSLEKWDSGVTMACKYTGIKYRITPDYEVERVEYPDGLSGAPPVPVVESEDGDVDVNAYIKTTFDPVEFLQAAGWQKLKQEHYEYWHKDYPLPHPYRMGGMTFTKLRVIVGFDLRLRGAFSAHVNVYWSDEEGRAFPVKGWTLNPQAVYPAHPEATDISDADLDYDLPLRRFVNNIEQVLNNIAWPENDMAVLHANTRLEAEFGRFVKELNQQAQAPIYPERPMEGRIPSADDPETFVRNKVNFGEAADDPDDPETVLQTQPGFEFRHTQHMGDMVFVKGPGEDRSDWPRDIGRVVQGPDNRWYVIGVRGVPPEQLDDYGYGIRRTPKLRTFGTEDEAALAIWLTWSRLSKKKQQGYLLQ